MNIILGSQSPRRRELLSGLDVPHTEVSIDADESYPADLTGGDIPKYISRAKAEAYTRTHELAQEDLLITSDTIVWLDGQVLGKPKDEADARHMLRLLSGKTHQVFTAVTFATHDSLTTEVDCTHVTFEPLSDEDINYYVTKYRPLDKAGAYGIQEWIGYIAAGHIDGSFYNVMGFPTHIVHRFLRQHYP